MTPLIRLIFCWPAYPRHENSETHRECHRRPGVHRVEPLLAVHLSPPADDGHFGRILRTGFEVREPCFAVVDFLFAARDDQPHCMLGVFSEAARPSRLRQDFLGDFHDSKSV